jgi:cell wall-associated NlpC family hydrolase
VAGGAVLLLAGLFVVFRTLRGHDQAGLIPTLRRATGGDPYVPAPTAAAAAGSSAATGVAGAGQAAATGAVHVGNLAGVIATARSVVRAGVPYKWGGSTRKGFDCSGLMVYLFARAGVHLPRTSYEQATVGVPVDWQHLQPGDLVFAATDGPGASHVVMYLGHGMVVAAPHPGADVQIEPLAWFRSTFVGARRVLVNGREAPQQRHGLAGVG